MLSLLDKEVITEDDINKLISLKVEESINLDFKQAEGLDSTKKKEIIKDISSFANSVGGFIVYGIKEENHVADSLSFIDGNIYTKEWIEQIIQTGIQRKIEELKIYPIRFDNNLLKSVYVVKIPESTLAPHMTSDKKFYKRYNFESVQMEEYEVRNSYNRKEKTNLIIHDVTISNQTKNEQTNIYFSLGFQIQNIGNVIERDFKLNIVLNKNIQIQYNLLADSKISYSIIGENLAMISIPNKSPIFPNEITTIGNIDIGISTFEIKEMVMNEFLKFKLLFSNGFHELELPLKVLIKNISNKMLVNFVELLTK